MKLFEKKLERYFSQKLAKTLTEDIRKQFFVETKIEYTKHGFCILAKPTKLKDYSIIFGIENSESFYFLSDYQNTFRLFKNLLERNYKERWKI